MPVKPSCSTRPLLAVPRNHCRKATAGGGYRAHLRVVTANGVSLIVGPSGPSNRLSVRAWAQRTLPYLVTSRCTCMPRHFNAACMAAPRCMSPPGPSHPSCWWEACPDTTKRACPQASQTNILPSQITASASLTSSAGSMMGQLSIGRFADPSWILHLHTNHWNTNPSRSIWQELSLFRTSGDIHSCSVRSASSAAAGTTNRCHPLIPRVALRPVRLQRPPVPAAILQLHAINVVAVVVLPRSHRGIR
ncbi:regulator of sigma E protease [Trypanosoma cruzi]|nr:regulator of sigma E protease [Trypanosoma cruzi]